MGNRPGPLSQIVSAHDYATRTTAVAVQIAQAVDPSALQALLRDGTNALGAESAVFVGFERKGADVLPDRFMLACDPEWYRRYVEFELSKHDPWLAYAAHQSEPILTSTLQVTEPAPRQAIDLAVEHGFVSTVLVPAHSGADRRRMSVLCLGSATPRFFEDDGFAALRVAARSIALELHDWWRAQKGRELVAKARLTPADLVLLRHEQQGHSSKRIAAELRVSKSSIDSRFQRMNDKLGVTNKRLAVELALEYGLIQC